MESRPVSSTQHISLCRRIRPEAMPSKRSGFSRSSWMKSGSTVAMWLRYSGVPWVRFLPSEVETCANAQSFARTATKCRFSTLSSTERRLKFHGRNLVPPTEGMQVRSAWFWEYSAARNASSTLEDACCMWASMYCNALSMNSSDSWTGWPLALNWRSVFSRCRMSISSTPPPQSATSWYPRCARPRSVLPGSDGSGGRKAHQAHGGKAHRPEARQARQARG